MFVNAVVSRWAQKLFISILPLIIILILLLIIIILILIIFVIMMMMTTIIIYKLNGHSS